MRYATALGVKGRQDGYLEGRGYLISWCFGHLWGLADAVAYDPKYKKWNKTDLPILPTTWQYQLLPGSQKQMALLRRLMDREDVTEKMDKAQAEALAAQCAGQTTVVEELRESEQVRTAPALLDPTALQRLANKQLGYTAQQTLDYAQSLYEKKLLTYPRTDSRYLTEDIADGVPELAQLCAAIAEEDSPEAILEKQVCCNGKVTDHTALLPTRSAGTADLSVLPTPELKLLQLVVRQVLLAVSPPWVRMETEVTISCSGARFTAKGNVTTQPG